MKKIIFLLLFTSSFAFAQHSVGQFQNAKDIGKPKSAGTTQYDKATKTYTMKGSGHNIWYDKDEFQFAYNKMKGDFILTADFAFLGEGMNHRKIGWMIRASDDEGSVHYSAVLHGDGLTVLQWRPAKGASMRDPQDEVFAPEKNYSKMQIERSGKKIIMRAAHAGEPLKEIGSTESQNLPDEVMAGIFVCAHDENVVVESKVTNVTIVKK